MIGESLLQSFNVKIRVIYADTDAMGVVYHTNYIKWLEIGRTEFLRKNDIIYAQLEERGYYFPVTEVYCNYLLPARYDQLIAVETSLEFMRRASMKFNYIIRDTEKEKILVEGYTVHACVNTKGKIVRIPLDIIEKVNDNRNIEDQKEGGK